MPKTNKALKLGEKVLNIQSELKVPKGQMNTFGNYKYRSCEDILEAVKPLLKKYRVLLILGDQLENIGERYYVKAIAKLEDLDSENTLMVTAFAREEEIKKGMDSSQITGASSSYARKYALNGLFGIDDEKDSDVTNNGKAVAKKTKPTRKSPIDLINSAKTLAELKKIEEAIGKAEMSDKNRQTLKSMIEARSAKLK